MKSYSQWTDEEVIKLFRFIEDGKKQNHNLSGMFSLYAKLTNRKPNSVRNYYYAELNELENNKERRKNFLENIGDTQVFVTCTDKIDIENLNSNIYNVIDGEVFLRKD